MRAVRAAKKKLIARIRELVRPHFWASGFLRHPPGQSIFKTKGTPIMLYAPKDGAWDADYNDDCMYGGPDALTEVGIVEVGCGGMAETPYEDVDAEDLATLADILETFDFKKGKR